MNNVIRLSTLGYDKPSGDSYYIILEGQRSIKPVTTSKFHIPLREHKEVVPFSLAIFHGKPLEELPACYYLPCGDEQRTVCYYHDYGMRIGGNVRVPGSRRIGPPADVRLYHRGELVAIDIPSNWVVHNHRVLKILEALPKIEGRHFGDIRRAEELVEAYARLNEGPKANREGQYKLDFETRKRQIPETASLYYGKITLEEIARILDSAPTDTFGNRIAPGGTTTLVIAHPSIREGGLVDMLKAA